MSEEDQTPITLQWCHVMFVLPISFMITIILMKLSTLVSKDFIFISVIITFTSFFMIHAFYLYPYRYALHSYFRNGHNYIHEHFQSDISKRILIPLFGCIMYPINTILFAVADIWGTVSLSVLIFGFVNDITPRNAAKRYYVALGILSQLGPIIAGSLVSGLMAKSINSGNANKFIESYQLITVISVSIMYLMLTIYLIIRFKLMKMEAFHYGGRRQQRNQNTQVTTRRQNEQKSIWETLKFAFSNYYILSLCGIILGYNWLNAIFEHTLKDILHLYFTGCQSGYSSYRGMLTTGTASLTFFAMIFCGHNLLRFIGWKRTAQLCPFVLFFGTVIFYAYGVINQQHYYDDELLQLKPTSSCYIMLIIGGIICVLEKALKYSTSDPTKEIAYLYLNDEEKYKGKIAVELIGAKLGKVCGAFFNIFLLSAINERAFFKSSEYMALIGIVIGGVIWLCSIQYVDNSIQKKSKHKKSSSG